MAADFAPPRCPDRRCRMHRDPQPRFFHRTGSYRPACRSTPVQRYRCKSCRRGFSYQTFRLDYRDRRPDRNEPLFHLLCSGVGLRQAARVLGLGVHSVQHKFRKLARNLGCLNRNLMLQLPAGRTYLLDELETFEHQSICPLTVPVLIEKASFAIVATGVAPIRRVARKGSRRQQRLERHERKHGRRKDRSRLCLRKVMGRFLRLLRGNKGLLISDEKQLYARLSRELLAGQVEHETVSGKLVRTSFNRLFGINLTDAMLRDNNGRLRRRSWLVSKRGRFLSRQLQLFTAYRNWHRPRTNHDDQGLTPGVELGLVSRRLQVAELLAWRQDWGRRSIHPTCTTGAATDRRVA